MISMVMEFFAISVQIMTVDISASNILLTDFDELNNKNIYQSKEGDMETKDHALNYNSINSTSTNSIVVIGYCCEHFGDNPTRNPQRFVIALALYTFPNSKVVW